MLDDDRLVHTKKGPQKQKTERKRLFFLKNGKRKKARREETEEGVVQAGALRSQRGANGARWENKEKNKKVCTRYKVSHLVFGTHRRIEYSTKYSNQLSV